MFKGVSTPGPRKWIPRCRLISLVFKPQVRLRLFLFTVFGLTASPVQAYNLLDIYKLAHENDPTFLQARSTHLADKEIQAQARAALLPKIEGEVFAEKNSVKRKESGASQVKADFDSKGYRLTLTQPLFNAAAFSAKSAANALARKAIAEFQAAEQNLIVRTAEAYFGYLRAEDNLRTTHIAKTAVKHQLDLAQVRLQVGLAAITEVHEAKAAYQLAEAIDIEDSNLVDDARQALREITNQGMSTVNALKESFPLNSPEPADIDVWLDSSRKFNQSIQAARANKEAARMEVRIQGSGHVPSLDLVGRYTRTDGNNSFVDPTQEVKRSETAIGLELSVPIFSGGNIASLTSEARHRFDAATYELDGVLRKIDRQTRQAFHGVHSGRKRVQALKQSVVARQSTLDAKTTGYRAGINTNKDVLDAQSALFRAQRDYDNARYEFILNQLRLKEAAGNLTVNDLVQLSEWLE